MQSLVNHVKPFSGGTETRMRCVLTYRSLPYDFIARVHYIYVFDKMHIRINVTKFIVPALIITVF